MKTIGVERHSQGVTLRKGEHVARSENYLPGLSRASAAICLVRNTLLHYSRSAHLAGFFGVPYGRSTLPKMCLSLGSVLSSHHEAVKECSELGMRF